MESNTLTIARGSLTVGAADPSGSATGGTVDLASASTLSFPSLTTGTSTFVVKTGGGGTGLVNMHGATISMAPARVHLDLEGDTLSSQASGGSVKDTVVGNVENNGIISFDVTALHTLQITKFGGTTGGTYTQDSGGTLSMRLANSQTNDLLTVAGTATLDGTLSLT